MRPAEIDQIIAESASIAEALRGLSRKLGYEHKVELMYGFFVHPHSYKRNDVVFGMSRFDSLARLFMKLGGTSTDPFARDNIDMVEPIAVDLDDFIVDAVERRDPRRIFYKAMRKAGIRTVWLCPIVGPTAGGYGVLVHYHLERYNPTEFPADYLLAFTFRVHESLRRHGLLAKGFKITPKELVVLRMTAQGRSGQDIAELEGVTQRTVENRLQSCRKKLKALTTTEAIYKAGAYGVI